MSFDPEHEILALNTSAISKGCGETANLVQSHQSLLRLHTQTWDKVEVSCQNLDLKPHWICWHGGLRMGGGWRLYFPGFWLFRVHSD